MKRKKPIKESSGKLKPAARKVRAQKRSKKTVFPIIGIGASAGGMEAFQQLLRYLPDNTCMAFVLIQHLAPEHKSMLTDLLSKLTNISVIEVKDGMQAEPDHVYVIPPNTNMSISSNVFKLVPRMYAHGRHLPVDYFFKSLAEDRKSRAIGVILSGTASDGTLGLGAIRAEGGITFAQDKESAKYDGMPQSAVAAGVVDFILPPKKIAEELTRIAKHPYVIHPKPAKIGELMAIDDDNLNNIFIMLMNATGVDFSFYKRSTIKRRIMRRLALHKIDRMEEYVRFLQENSDEQEELFDDMLIKVTGFFREPETFESLKDVVFPEIMKKKQPDEPIRIWVPGCSTGEEVYSIAISLLEFLGDKASTTLIQIFATDLSDKAIEKARRGIYEENSISGILPDRLQRFFIKKDSKYTIIRSIRDMCVFAKQNVIKDPPFSNLDLVSCRNLLIYLGPVLQKKVISILHYALKPKGFLLLGTSETVGGSSNMFKLVDKKNKIYSKSYVPTRPDIDFISRGYAKEKADTDEKKGTELLQEFDVEKEANQIVLSKYAPAGVIINSEMEVLQFRGHTGPYLEPAPGKASLNILKMAREDLLLHLRTAIYKAREGNVHVKKEGVSVKYNGQSKLINIVVTPIKNPSFEEYCFLILFEDAAPPVPISKKPEPIKVKPGKGKQSAKDRQITLLEKELESSKEYLQSIIEDQERTNEELKSANEEIQSSNEELQSTNEELETAKEELQSTNEELNTLNDELRNRNVELTNISNDMINILKSVHIPIVILENDFRIRRITPAAEELLNVIPADMNRKITDIKLKIDIPDIEQLLLEVMNTSNVKEREVQGKDGKWYSLQIRPYKTEENRIDGAVIALMDIDLIKRSLEEVKEARNYAENIIETIHEPLVVLDSGLRVISANHSFYETFEVKPDETENTLIYDLGNRQWNIPRLRKLLVDILPKNTAVEDFEVKHSFPTIGERIMLLNAHRIHRGTEKTQTILLAIEDITERERAEREHEERALRKMKELENIDRMKDEFFSLVTHEIQNPLTSVKVQGQLLMDEIKGKLTEKQKKSIETVLIDTNRIIKLTDDIMTVSKMRTGALKVEIVENNIVDIIEYSINNLKLSAKEKNIDIIKKYPELLPLVKCDKNRITQVMNNLIENAVKFTPENGKIIIDAKKIKNDIVVSVEDTGIGISKENQKKIFNAFFQVSGKSSGAGLGLSVCKNIIDAHHGKIWVESALGKGSKFIFTLPVIQK